MLTEDLVRKIKKAVRRAVRNIKNPEVIVHHGTDENSATSITQKGLSGKEASIKKWSGVDYYDESGQKKQYNASNAPKENVFVSPQQNVAQGYAKGRALTKNTRGAVVSFKVRKNMLSKNFNKQHLGYPVPYISKRRITSVTSVQ